MRTKPESMTRPEARPASQAPAPREHSRPGAKVRARAPRRVTVTLEDVIRVLQDCTDNDELVVSVVSNLLHSGALRSQPGFQVTLRYAAA